MSELLIEVWGKFIDENREPYFAPLSKAGEPDNVTKNRLMLDSAMTTQRINNQGGL